MTSPTEKATDRSRRAGVNVKRSARALFRSFCGGLLQIARTLEGVRQCVVPFVARVLVDRLFGFGHRDPCRPRFGEGRWIVDGEFVHERVGGDAGEALDEMQVL